MIHPHAGRPVSPEALIDPEALQEAYYAFRPDASNPHHQVSFGTSGHRGIATEGSFNELHIAAIAQAICDGRAAFGATGPCLVGADTHCVSALAKRTVLEVLAGNGVVAAVDADDDFVPTPALSRAILRENAKGGPLWDGILLTPSHNPPEHGGIKYNPTHGGPAEGKITSWIAQRANEYLAAQGEGIRRCALEEAPATATQPYPFRDLYVQELPQVVDIEAIRKARLHVLVDALGGSGARYWEVIRDTYGLDLTVIHTEYDPTFSFMRCDHDGKVRMDCSSAYAMQGVIDLCQDYDLAVGNDPDFDRYGIVTTQGMLSANAFLAVAGAYLFAHRDWQGKGMGKTIVVTSLVDRWAADNHVPVYETPVGFKYFADLLAAGTVGLAGEESAGGSFLMRDGRAWTTDKDGMLMALLAMEIMAVTGESLDARYAALTDAYGTPHMGRRESACTREERERLLALRVEDVQEPTLAGDPITAVRTTAHYEDLPFGGVRIETAHGWLVARPSGTEPLYKLYGETYRAEAGLEALFADGQKLLQSVLS